MKVFSILAVLLLSLSCASSGATEPTKKLTEVAEPKLPSKYDDCREVAAIVIMKRVPTLRYKAEPMGAAPDGTIILPILSPDHEGYVLLILFFEGAAYERALANENIAHFGACDFNGRLKYVGVTYYPITEEQ